MHTSTVRLGAAYGIRNPATCIPTKVGGRLDHRRIGRSSEEHRGLQSRSARLRWLDRATGQVIRRYGHAKPGDLIHLDVRKLGRIPDGGGWRTLGKAAGRAHSLAHTTVRSASRHPVIGYNYLHTALGGHPPVSHVPNLSGQYS